MQIFKRSKAATKSQTYFASHSREVATAVSRAVVVLCKAWPCLTLKWDPRVPFLELVMRTHPVQKINN